jgi:hypothetical protein
VTFVRDIGIGAWSAANSALRQRGYEVIRSAGHRSTSFRIQRVTLPGGVRPACSRPDGTFLVDVARMTTDCGFSFAPGGWHPFVRTLEEYTRDPGLVYDASTLHRLHERFQPQSVQDLLLEEITTPVQPLSEWPPIRRLFRRVWALTPWLAERELRTERARPGRGRTWLYFGPTPEDFRREEFDRLTGVYDNIRHHGYRAALAATSPINGYFLKRGGDYRFVVLNGNHRVAVLAHLGIREVPVVIRVGHPSVVDEDRLDQWSLARGGLYPRGVAALLFEKMFSETGCDKAARLGLL